MASATVRAHTVGVFATRDAAERAVADLRKAGYRDDQIGLVGKDASGKTQSWAVELVGINDLLRRGWGRDKVHEGDVISVDGFGAKNGTNTVNAKSVSLASTGQLLWASEAREEQKKDIPQ